MTGSSRDDDAGRLVGSRSERRAGRGAAWFVVAIIVCAAVVAAFAWGRLGILGYVAFPVACVVLSRAFADAPVNGELQAARSRPPSPVGGRL